MRVRVGMGSCGLAAGAREVMEQVKEEITSRGLNIQVQPTGCIGMCHHEPLLDVVTDDGVYTYGHVTPEVVKAIFDEHIVGKKPLEKYLVNSPEHQNEFLAGQVRIALRDCGIINLWQIADYEEHGGYQGLRKAITTMTPEEVINEIKEAGLRGRGGGGFPTWFKWQAARQNEGAQKYVVCNADEGDPGAFMDRSILEGDPHTVIEGMIICAYAIGATAGFIYVRDEYDLAVKNLTNAIMEARRHGYLGKNILGSELSFDIEIVRGGGAFVCGEETALINSIQGNVGEPWDKYVFPTEKGLWGQPTVINNVETWANVPVIIREGAAKFASIGTEGSKGTKLFSLVGKVVKAGLVEVPMGTTLREIIFDIGGGIQNGRKFKAVQTGGPSGGCIPESLLDLPVDFDTLTQAGSMMGSGGMIVMDDRTCMVEVARYYVNFLAGESCGKCVPCREGISLLLETLTRICEGKGKLEDLDLLESMSSTIQKAALCALGRTAPNPVLSTLKYFRDEYLEHINNHRCPAGICKELTEFYIDEELCTGCGRCRRNCPADAITGEKKKAHTIDPEKCIKCGECIDNCRFQAVKVK